MSKIVISAALCAALANVNAADQGGGVTPAGAYNITNDKVSQDQLRKLPESSWPVVTQEAVQHEARIADVDRVEKDGLVYYRVAFKNQDASWTAKVLVDGMMVDIKRQTMNWEDVPKAVRDAVTAEAKQQGSDSIVSEVEATRRNGQPAYRAVIQEDGHGQEALFDVNGQKLQEREEQH